MWVKKHHGLLSYEAISCVFLSQAVSSLWLRIHAGLQKPPTRHVQPDRVSRQVRPVCLLRTVFLKVLHCSDCQKFSHIRCQASWHILIVAAHVTPARWTTVAPLISLCHLFIQMWQLSAFSCMQNPESEKTVKELYVWFWPSRGGRGTRTCLQGWGRGASATRSVSRQNVDECPVSLPPLKWMKLPTYCITSPFSCRAHL